MPSSHATRDTSRAILGVLLLLVSSAAFGTDLLVEEGGVSPNYGSIQDAIDAAVDGDRIFIDNRAGDIPWVENLTINTNVQLLPQQAEGVFHMTGSVTIIAQLGREVAIIGMHNTSGSVSSNTGNAPSPPGRIHILGCHLESGSIPIHSGWVLHAAGNRLDNGYISFYRGIVSGNEVSNGYIYLAGGDSIATDSTVFIVGNRLSSAYIQAETGSHYVQIANNWVQSDRDTGLIDINAVKSGAQINLVYNNSLMSTNPSLEGIDVVGVPVGASLEIQNNAMRSLSAVSTTGISGSVTGFVLIEYNVTRNYGTAINVTGATVANNSTSGSLALDGTTGACTTDCTDLGNPDPKWTDLDLTTNDRGTGGGSFNYTNFHPILTGGARVYLVDTPRVLVGASQISIAADAFDR